jgi:hypothetical protein
MNSNTLWKKVLGFSAATSIVAAGVLSIFATSTTSSRDSGPTVSQASSADDDLFVAIKWNSGGKGGGKK